MKSNYVVILVLMLVFNSYAQDGSLDTSFGGGDGYIEINNSGNNENHYIRAFDVSATGNSIVVGYTTTIPHNEYVNNYIAKVLESGAIDNSFGNGGFIVSTEDTYQEVAIQSDEKLLISKYNSQSQVSSIIRLLPDGSLDSNFGNNGIVVPTSPGLGVYKIVIDSEDNFFIYSSEVINNMFTVFIKKYLPNGAIDNTYGNNGMNSFEIENSSDFNILLSLEGGIGSNLLVTYKKILGNDEYSNNIAEFLPNGSINTVFGNNGKLEIPVEYDTIFNNTSCSSLYFENGTILTGCRTFSQDEDPINTSFKYTPNGILDITFGTNGALEGAKGIIIQPNQRFLSDESLYDFEGGIYPSIKRYFPNGTIDTSFQFDSVDVFGEMETTILNNGKIMLFASSIWYNGPIYTSISRYNNTILGVENRTINKIAIYPNPSKETFNINFQNLENDLPYQVVDVTGKIIVKGIFTKLENTLKLSQVKTGVYFLNVGSKGYKLIKQ